MQRWLAIMMTTLLLAGAITCPTGGVSPAPPGSGRHAPHPLLQRLLASVSGALRLLPRWQAFDLLPHRGLLRRRRRPVLL